MDNATLRLANSFITKSKKYQDSYKGLEHVKGKPYVIAIAPFDSPYTSDQRLQAIHRVLYGFDRHIAIDWDDENREILDTIYMEEIKKNTDTGSKVPLGYFTNREHAHVSAVIFSNTANFSKVRVMCEDPRIILVQHSRYNEFGTQTLDEVVEKQEYDEHLLDGLIIFHNPFANIPFNNKEFYHPIIAHSTVDVETNENLNYFPHGHLFQRLTVVMDGPSLSSKEADNLRLKLKESVKNNQTIFPRYHK